MSAFPLKIEKLVLENFYSYGRRTEITFSDGVTVIVGENGAGKSSIVRGIYFALLGELPDVKISDAIHKGKKEFFLSLTMMDEKNRYRIERRRGGQRSDALYIDAGNGEKLVAIGTEEVTKKLSQIVLSSDLISGLEKGVKRTIIDLIILNQGKLDEIGEALSSGRKDKAEFLLNMLGLSAYLKAWEKMKDLTVKIAKPQQPPPPELGFPEKEKYRVTEDDLEEAEERLKRALEGVEKIEKELKDVKQKITMLAEKEKELAISKEMLEKEKNKLAMEMGNINSQLSKAREAQSMLEKLEQQILNIKKEESRVERELKEAENLKKQLDDLKLKEKLAFYIELERELDSFLENTRAIKSDALELGIAGKLEEIEATLKKELEVVENKLRELEGKKAIMMKNEEEARKLKLEIERKEKELSSEVAKIAMPFGLALSSSDPIALLDEVETYFSNAIKEKRSLLASLKAEHSRLNRSIEELREAKGKCPVCGRELDEEHRSMLLSEYGQRVGQISKDIAKLEAEIDLLENNFHNISKLRSKAGEIEALKGRLNKSFTQDNINALQEIDSEIIELNKRKDSISGLLHSIGKAIISKTAILEKISQSSDITTDLNDVKAENLEALQEITKSIRAEMDSIVPYVGKNQYNLMELRKKISFLEKKVKELQPEAKSAELSGLREKRKSLEEQEKQLKEEASKLKQLEEMMASIKIDFDRVSKDLSDVESELRSVRDELSSLKSRGKTLEEGKKYLEQLSKSLSDAVFELKVLLKVRSLYERETGLPSILMKHALKELKRWLAEIYRKFNLSYDDIKIDDSFNISLINSMQNLEISLEQASGGERVAVYLSFIFAAQRVIAELYGGGRRAGFIVLDEPTNYLDEDRVKHLADVLREAVSAGGGAQIIVVTHDENLKDAGDVVLRVRKSGAISTIEEEVATL